MGARTRKTGPKGERRTDTPRHPPPDEISPETRAADLLPPNRPYVPPAKRIAERRVAGYALSERLLSRRARRPAGNSRRFWARVEEDDPFLPAPPGGRLPQGEVHAPAAADRLARVEPPAPRSQPGQRAEPPPQRHTTEPRPVKPPTPPPKPAPPEREHEVEATPPPRPPPKPPPPKAPPRPSPAAVDEAPPAFDRRPPMPPPPNRPTSARVPTPPQRPPGMQRALVDASGRSSADVRREREQARKGPQLPPRRSIDDYLSILGDLAASEKLYREGKLLEEQEEAEAAARPTPAPQPRPAPPRPPPPRPPPPKPPAARPARPADDEDDLDLPPSPPGPPPSGPINRSPKAAVQGPTGAGLDDLFGGAQEGRVKIPKRTAPKPKPDG